MEPFSWSLRAADKYPEKYANDGSCTLHWQPSLHSFSIQSKTYERHSKSVLSISWPDYRANRFSWLMRTYFHSSPHTYFSKTFLPGCPKQQKGPQNLFLNDTRVILNNWFYLGRILTFYVYVGSLSFHPWHFSNTNLSSAASPSCQSCDTLRSSCGIFSIVCEYLYANLHAINLCFQLTKGLRLDVPANGSLRISFLTDVILKIPSEQHSKAAGTHFPYILVFFLFWKPTVKDPQNK